MALDRHTYLAVGPVLFIYPSNKESEMTRISVSVIGDLAVSADIA
jgi:hypothetical protein